MADTVVDEYILFRFSKLYRDGQRPEYNRIVEGGLASSLVSRAQVIIDNDDVTITYQVVPKKDVNNI